MLATTIGTGLAAGFCFALQRKRKRTGHDARAFKRRKITLSNLSLLQLQTQYENEKSASDVEVEESLAKHLHHLPIELQDHILFTAASSSRQTCHTLLRAVQSVARHRTLMKIYLRTQCIYPTSTVVDMRKGGRVRSGFFLPQTHIVEFCPDISAECEELACTASLFTQLNLQHENEGLQLTLLDSPSDNMITSHSAHWLKVTKLAFMNPFFTSSTYQHPDFSATFRSLTHLAITYSPPPSVRFDALHPLTLLPHLQSLVYLVNRPSVAIGYRGSDWDIVLSHIFNDRRVLLLPHIPMFTFAEGEREDEFCEWWTENHCKDIWEDAKVYTNERAQDVLQRTLSEHLIIPDIQALQIMSSLCAQPLRDIDQPLTSAQGGVAPGRMVKRLTAGEKVIKVPVDSEKLDIGKVMRGFAGHARDWEVGVSWFNALFGQQEERQEDNMGSREIQVKQGKEEECLRLTILDSDCLPCQGFWPAYKAPELGRVTHLCLRKGMAGVNVDWTAFPSLTHLALLHDGRAPLRTLVLSITRVKKLIPLFEGFVVIIRPVFNMDAIVSQLAHLTNIGVQVRLISDVPTQKTMWEQEFLEL